MLLECRQRGSARGLKCPGQSRPRWQRATVSKYEGVASASCGQPPQLACLSGFQTSIQLYPAPTTPTTAEVVMRKAPVRTHTHTPQRMCVYIQSDSTHQHCCVRRYTLMVRMWEQSGRGCLDVEEAGPKKLEASPALRLRGPTRSDAVQVTRSSKASSSISIKRRLLE